MSSALKEIIEVFEKWNVDIQMVFLNGTSMIDFCYEDENGINHELDGFWEERIKAHSLRGKLKNVK